MNISSALLVPLTGLSYNHLKVAGYKIYMGDYNDSGTEWTNDLYVHLKIPESSLLAAIESDPSYYKKYDDEDGTMYVKSLTRTEISTILKPIREGRYSEVSRAYVEKYFPKHRIAGFKGGKLVKEFRQNYMVFTKHPKLRNYWEELLDVVIDENAELWDKPIKSREIKNYDKHELEFQKSGDELSGDKSGRVIPGESAEGHKAEESLGS